MADEFTGPGTRMSEGDIASAAEALGCEVAAVKAVIDVESRGGFFADGRPKILFERHKFSGMTGGRFDGAHPGISSRTAGGYKGGPPEYDRLAEAIALDRTAALKSASWGAFQILGDNFAVAGFPDVESFVKAMCQSENNQLRAFVNFVRGNGLADELQRQDWAGFARGYNGPKYKQNNYDIKLAAAYIVHLSGPRAEPAPGGRTLGLGDQGEDVAALQRRLNLPVDNDFGPTTKAAVIAFQAANGLSADGIVGPATRGKLGI